MPSTNIQNKNKKNSSPILLHANQKRCLFFSIKSNKIHQKFIPDVKHNLITFVNQSVAGHITNMSMHATHLFINVCTHETQLRVRCFVVICISLSIHLSTAENKNKIHNFSFLFFFENINKYILNIWANSCSNQESSTWKECTDEQNNQIFRSLHTRTYSKWINDAILDDPKARHSSY